MSVTERTFAELSDADVAAELAELTERVQEDNPNLDVGRGVFHDLVLHYQSLLSARRRALTADYLNARSLRQIEADPALADPDLVDDALSNFRVTRQPGGAAAGEVAVVRDNDLTVTLSAGTRFEANGLGFVTTVPYTAKAEASQVNSASDRLITGLRDGNYVFTVPVVAEDTGSAYSVRKNSLMVPDVPPGGYVVSYAAVDFSGGFDAETNQQLVERLQQGVAAKALSNRVNMAAMLREIEAFSRVVGMSIVGYGDAEMRRDRHGLLPISSGGRVDWYVRSAERFSRVSVTAQASLVAKTADYRGVWRVAIGRDAAPAFYEVDGIRLTGAPADAPGFAASSDTRAFDVSGAGFKPDLVSAEEAAYTAFQTAVIEFEDTDTDTLELELGTTQSYDVTLRCMPLIGDVQATVSGRDVRHYGADCLVRAPVPCFVSIGFDVLKQQGQRDPDLDAIKEALCAAINTTGFTGSLYSSALYDVVHGLVESGTSVGAIDMLGRLRYPGGETAYVRDANALVVPDEPERGVSKRTVQFFIEPNDISAVVRTVPAAEA